MNDTMEELLPIVAELAEKYTSKESTSIPYQKARQLMGAVLYCIQEYRTAGSSNAYALASGDVSSREAYQKGYQLVLQKTEQAKVRYHEIIKDFCYYKNQAYQDTFEHGMPAFFVHYDARFQPQNHILTLDYPILKPLGKETGIDAISTYINCIGLEQMFLARLPESFIYHVLYAYHREYKELLINIPAIVLRNLLGCIVAGKMIDDQAYSLSQQQQIRDVINNQSGAELKALFQDLIDKLMVHQYESNTELGRYLGYDLDNFVVELKNAIQYDHLHRVLALN